MFLPFWKLKKRKQLKKVRKFGKRLLCSRTKLRSFKIVIVGCENCGKSSVVRRFAGDIFYDYKNDPVVNMFSILTYIEVSDRMTEFETEIIELQSKGFKSQEYKKNFSTANAYVFVYDRGDKNSLEELKTSLQEMQILKAKQTPVVILGNKSDLRGDTTESERHFYGYRHFDVSAKTNTGIDEAFDYLFQSYGKS